MFEGELKERIYIPYENTAVSIYSLQYPLFQKADNVVHTLFLLFLLKNIDCGYSLEPPPRRGSNEYPQYMFWAEI